MLSDTDFFRRLKKDDGFLPSVGGWDGWCVSACEDEDAVWGAFVEVFVCVGGWLLVFGVVRGRLAE